MRILKWIGITLGGLLAILLIVVVVLNVAGRRKAASGPIVVVRPPAPAPDTTVLDRGRHLAQAITPCEACHGPGLAGKPFAMPAVLVSMAAPNLTRGKGGVGSTYTDEDWDRAIRHGVARDGRRLIVMPSEAYANLSDEDFSALLAYVKNVPPADHELPPRKIGVVGGAMVGAGMFQLASNMIPHDRVGSRHATPAVNAEYGAYLVDIAGCRICHGENLTGGKPNGPPPGPDLVTLGGQWKFDQFVSTLRTGRDPSGHSLNPELMPWSSFARMTDDELRAIWTYIGTIKAPTKASPAQ